jgi:DUF2075 family protein
MLLYQGSTKEFVRDTVHNRIADLMRHAYETYYRRKVSPSEYSSWVHSLQAVENLITHYQLLDNFIVLEYELPYCNQRIDCTLFGQGVQGERNVVIIELKQWSQATLAEVEGNIIIPTPTGPRMVPHPALQVQGYHQLLLDFVEAFHTELSLSSCAYCHNYSREQYPQLFAAPFHKLLSQFPVFTKEDFAALGEYLQKRLAAGSGLEIFHRFIQSPIRPSKKLLDYASRMIQGQKTFSLINEQITAHNTIIDRVKKAAQLPTKTVILVRGGPGTGKSVIALNAVAELARMGKTVFHATGSKAFTQTLHRIVGPKAKALFRYFNSFIPARTPPNSLDALICDEAHRIRETSNDRFTRRHLRSALPQIDELIRAAKVSVFFIDDYQVVRPGEIGSSQLIREAAHRWNAQLFEFELLSQFRCNGSDGYLAWINNILGLEENDKLILTPADRMEFRIFPSPTALYQAIMAKNHEKPNSARLVAGFCWPWSDPNPDGTLVNDVVIGEFAMPWEGREGKPLAPGIPPWFEWAYRPEGVHQVGCIYTAQGFEFDYIGVIFGPDLVYDPNHNRWVGQPHHSHDPMLKRARGDEFTAYVKNVYRVLLTRGMRGCYVYFIDKNTENFFRSRIDPKLLHPQGC